MRKRTRYSLLLMLALVAGLVAAVWLRKNAPPEVARLLPESDAIVYANLKPLRLATHFDRTPVTRSPEYQHFVDATGHRPRARPRRCGLRPAQNGRPPRPQRPGRVLGGL